MPVKGYFDFNVVVAGRDGNGKAVSEFRQVRFDMIFMIRSGIDPQDKSVIAKEGAVDLVRESHPTWRDLVVTSCIEV